jgi:arylsulfatase A-like enzyme
MAFAAGAVLGAAFGAAEMLARHLTGGLVSARWWGLVLLHDVPAFACLCAALTLLRLDRGRRSLRYGVPFAVASAASLALALTTGTRLSLARRPDPSVYWSDAPQPTQPAPARPSVVLIVLDALRARQLSSYGYSRPTTPRLDGIARQGIRYSRCYSPAPSSLPAHASLFTGLFPTRHGAHARAHTASDAAAELPALPESVDTLAAILLRHGYATAAISANFGQVSRLHGLDRGFRHFDAWPSDAYSGNAYTPLIARVLGRLPAPLIARSFEEWLATPYRRAEEINVQARRWLLRRPPGRPYFLFLNYLDVHAPYAAPGDRGRAARRRARQRGFPPTNLPSRTVVQVMRGERDLTADEADHIISLYDAALAYLDEQVGRLVDLVDAQPDTAGAWIVITSDHGEALGEHRTLQHGCSLYEELVHVPLIVRPPASVRAARGTVDGRLVQLVDVMPTILDAVGIAVPAGLDGTSLATGRETAYAESFAEAYPMAMAPARQGRELQAAIAVDWKYIRSSAGGEELFDLAHDPAELTNLTPARPEQAAALRARLKGWEESLARSAPPAPPLAPISADQRERLKALGYVR